MRNRFALVSPAPAFLRILLRSRAAPHAASGRGIVAWILFATFCCAQALAQHAPTTFISVSNDGVIFPGANSDRFSDAEAAARTSIERHNTLLGGYYYVFDHLVYHDTPTIQAWDIYANAYDPSGVFLGGPFMHGSSAIRWFVCDATPRIGPNYSGDSQLMPKVVTYSPTLYANGCPTPEVDIDKNPCLGNCESNPLNVGTTSKIQVEKDYSADGASGSLRFERTYNSVGFTADAMIPYATLGLRWRHNFDRFVTLYQYPSISTAAVLRPNGTVLKFTLTSGVWTPDADVADRLQRLTDGGGNPSGWALTTAERDVETYDVAGRLILVAFRDGKTQTLTYSNSGTSPAIAPVPGLLIDVTDNFGRSLQFVYDANKRIQSFTDPAGNAYGFTYDSSNNLASVTRPGSAARTYVYGELSLTQNVQQKNNLTGIVDESGNRFSSYGYDMYGHAISSSRNNGIALTTVAYTLNGNANVTSVAVTDPLGFTRSKQFVFPRGVVKRSAEIENAATTALSYDTNGNLTRSVDKNGNSTCLAYDTTRNLETVRVEGFASTVATCPANLASYSPVAGTRERKIVTAWHGTYRLPTTVTEANRTTSFTHAANGNVLTRKVTDTSVTPNVVRTWTYTYDSFGRVLTENGPRTDVTDLSTFTYYTCSTGFQCGQLNTIQNALGHVTTYNTYNAHGQPTQITDANGLVTSLSYDARQRLTDRCTGGTLPGCSGAELTHLDYWPTGLLKKVTNPDASYIEYIYDSAHRLTEIKDGELNKIVYTLDNAGNRTAENAYDPSFNLKRTHTRVFNTLNQLWKDVSAAGTANVTTVFGYDNNGNQASTNAPLSRNSTSLYDELNRLKQITDPASGNTLFGYDTNDNLTSVTDPRTLVTSYSYSGFGDVKTQTSPDTGVTTNTYDSGGNLKTSTDARGAITTYTYDALSRVKTANFKLGSANDPAITYTYDAGTNGKGHLTGASDSNHSMSWTYDAQGRVIGKGQTVVSVTKSIGYGYNASVQLASTLLPSGQLLTYGYNANNQVTSITLAGSPNVTILSGVTYDPFGPITGWTWGNNTTASRSFDTDGKLTQVTSAGLRTLGYDDAFRITAVNDIAAPTNSWSLGYDTLDRLNVATKTGTTIGYSYDANGNRQTQTGTSASTYAVDAASNRLSSTTGALARTYIYDAVGNVLDSGATVHTYNNRGRMKTARLSSTSTNTGYIYNALGQRVRKAGGTPGTVFFVYDEAGHLVGEYNSSGVLIQETVWLGDIPVATLRSISGVMTVFYVHTDQLNTPRKVTNTANTIRWKWDPTPFGEGIPVEPAGAFKYNLRFPGQYFDLETNLNYNYFRGYDPATGRYVESDPIGLGGGINTFGYVSASPVGNVDPLGLAGTVIAPSPAGGIFGIILGTPIANPFSETNHEWARNAASQITNSLGWQSSPIEEPIAVAACPPGGDPCAGLRAMLREHENRLAKYVANPILADNRGMIGAAFLLGLADRYWDIYMGRIAKLRGQIANFKKLIAECEAKNGKR